MIEHLSDPIMHMIRNAADHALKREERKSVATSGRRHQLNAEQRG